MKSKKKHEEWKELVSDFNESGLSMATFCKGKDLKPSTFIYWVKMFNKPVNKVPKLVKLPVNSMSNLDPIQISINNIKIELPGITA